MSSRVRQKIRSDNVIVETLENLNQGTRERPALDDLGRQIAGSTGLAFRSQAVSYALTVLKACGLAENDARGSWKATVNGRAITISAEELRDIARRHYSSRIRPR